MAEHDDAAASAFEQERGYLFSIAYRLLSSVSDAEDTVQDAFIRWQRDAWRYWRVPPGGLPEALSSITICVYAEPRLPSPPP